MSVPTHFLIGNNSRSLVFTPFFDFGRRPETKDDESTCLSYTGLLEALEYLKIETRLIDEKFASVMGECVI